jgi:hypothetical protein
MALFFWDANGDEPVYASGLLNGHVGTATDLADMVNYDVSTLPSGIKAYVPNYGIFALDKSSAEPINELNQDYIFDANGGGQWVLISTSASDSSSVEDLIFDYNLTFLNNTTGGTGSGSASVMELRLTLQDSTPIMTSDVTAATTLYLTPYIGNNIGLFNGVDAWSTLSTDQVSLSLSSLSANTNYDIFAYNNSGSVSLEPLVWANSNPATSARATSLVYQDGILVKSGGTTRRYIGTIRTTGTAGQSEFSFGGLSVGGTEAKLFVWNYYNRIQFDTFVGTTTNYWTVNTSGLYRAAQNSSSYRTSFVVGIVEDSINAIYSSASNSGATNQSATIGVGLNSSTVYSGSTALANTASDVLPMIAKYGGKTSEGFNFVTALEASLESSTVTFYGESSGTTLTWNTGLHFTGYF